VGYAFDYDDALGLDFTDGTPTWPMDVYLSPCNESTGECQPIDRQSINYNGGDVGTNGILHVYMNKAAITKTPVHYMVMNTASQFLDSSLTKVTDEFTRIDLNTIGKDPSGNPEALLRIYFLAKAGTVTVDDFKTLAKHNNTVAGLSNIEFSGGLNNVTGLDVSKVDFISYMGVAFGKDKCVDTASAVSLKRPCGFYGDALELLDNIKTCIKNNANSKGNSTAYDKYWSKLLYKSGEVASSTDKPDMIIAPKNSRNGMGQYFYPAIKEFVNNIIVSKTYVNKGVCVPSDVQCNKYGGIVPADSACVISGKDLQCGGKWIFHGVLTELYVDQWITGAPSAQAGGLGPDNDDIDKAKST
jgi:hypothetical protein